MHLIKIEGLKPSDFAKYLGTLGSPVTGCLLNQKMYKNKKTSLYNLFKKYNMKATDDLFDDDIYNADYWYSHHKKHASEI